MRTPEKNDAASLASPRDFEELHVYISPLLRDTPLAVIRLLTLGGSAEYQTRQDKSPQAVGP